MAKLESVESLNQFRSQVRETVRRGRETGTVISVGLGTCGIAAGAREVVAAIEAELARWQIEAQVASVGCIGICAREPLIDIQQAGRGRVFYGNIQPEMVPRLIEEHLVKGRPVREWIVGRMVEG